LGFKGVLNKIFTLSYHFYTICLLIGISGLSGISNSYAQSLTLSGYIKDKNTGEGLPSASIYLPQLKTGVRSNDFGYYSVPIKKDTLQLKISYSGYKTLDTTIINQGSQTITFLLVPEILELEEVVITDNLATQTLESSQMSVISLPMTRIKQIPVIFGEADPIKVLQLMPGVRNNSEGNAGFFVRGGGADQNLVLLDGAPVYNASHLFGFFSIFNPDAVKGVELYKGGFPARYGGRLSSVLDIQLKDGNSNKTKVSGGLGLIASRLTVEGPIGKKQKGSWIASGRRTYLDVFTRQLNRSNRNNPNWNQIPDYYFYDLNLKVNYQVSPKDHIFLSGYFGRDVFGFNGSLINVDFGWGNASATLRWNHELSSKWFINQSFIFSDYRYSIENRLDLFSIRLFSSIRDYGYKVDIDFLPNPKHVVKMGAWYTFHTLEPGGYEGSTADGSFQTRSATKVSGQDLALFIQDDWDISPRWKSNLGMRLSGYATQDTVFPRIEPRLAFRWKWNQHRSLKFSYSRMAQYLHLVSNSSISLPTDLWFPTTKRLRPQLSDQIAGGIAQTFWKNQLTLTVESYYKWMQNPVEYREGAQVFFNPELEKEFVQGRGWSYGYEFLLQKTEGKWTGWIGYTLSWTWRQFGGINQGIKFPARNDRRHDWVSVFTWNLTRRALVSATFVYTTGNAITLPEGRYITFDQGTLSPVVVPIYPPRNSLRMPDYYRLDLGFTWKFDPKWGHSDLTFSIYNALNRRNPYLVFFEEIRNDNEEILGFRARQISLFPIIPAITYNFTF
jgi:hypothetical protein